MIIREIIAVKSWKPHVNVFAYAAADDDVCSPK